MFFMCASKVIRLYTRVVTPCLLHNKGATWLMLHPKYSIMTLYVDCLQAIQPREGISNMYRYVLKSAQLVVPPPTHTHPYPHLHLLNSSVPKKSRLVVPKQQATAVAIHSPKIICVKFKCTLHTSTASLKYVHRKCERFELKNYGHYIVNILMVWVT